MLENNQKEIILLKDLGMLYPKADSKQKRRLGLYKCFCGNEFKSSTYRINSKKTKSCGCLHSLTISNLNMTHGLSKHTLYSKWNDMMSRCNNLNNESYKEYGARGIKVCERWHDVKNFIEDMYPTFVEGLTLDRQNNNLGYFNTAIDAAKAYDKYVNENNLEHTKNFNKKSEDVKVLERLKK